MDRRARAHVRAMLPSRASLRTPGMRPCNSSSPCGSYVRADLRARRTRSSLCVRCVPGACLPSWEHCPLCRGASSEGGGHASTPGRVELAFSMRRREMVVVWRIGACSKLQPPSLTPSSRGGRALACSVARWVPETPSRGHFARLSSSTTIYDPVKGPGEGPTTSLVVFTAQTCSSPFPTCLGARWLTKLFISAGRTSARRLVRLN